MENNLVKLLPDARIATDIVIESSLAGASADLIERIGFSGKKLALVCDVNTYKALGKRLMNELAALKPELILPDGKIHADDATFAVIRNSDAEAFIAAGSGTISDLCKYASFVDNKSYCVFPTAPSMNGYLSANASMTMNGVKGSHAAHLPRGVFCDIEILAAAPKRLLASGLGDSLCRPTAQADWLLSHLVLGTAYNVKPFDMLKPYEAELFAHADRLVDGDPAIVKLLVMTLLSSGLGMTLSGGSYPASQGEHMIAHTMEMQYGDALPETYHGEQIGVTTLTMARLQEKILSRPLRLPPCPLWEGGLAGYFGRKRAQIIAGSAAKKYALYEEYDAVASRVEKNESMIRDAIREVIIPEAGLRKVLQKAGAPASATALGWKEGDYAGAVAHAAFTRDRFTFLDMVEPRL